ncbi:MAG TPA: hypothetical protein DER09_09245 [Prolixibacteraceae bacterium]|nr:hypothetical protein [Prolixibacteraceae bacterium]
MKIIISLLILLIDGNRLFAESFPKKESFGKVEFSTTRIPANSPSFAKDWRENADSVHRFDFRYNDRKRGIKPYIAPVLLISTGTVLHFSTETKENFQDWVQENTSYTGRVEDYLEYAPLAVVYGLNVVGVKGKNNFGNRTAIVVKSLVLNDLMVSSLKTWVGEKRPSGGVRSFPSGHTSVAFALAQFMHHEYGDKSIWYSVGAYSCATTVGMMRVAGNAHWISDVVASAGFGMLSTELVYLTHQYKWDKEHLRRLDIFPWSNQKQKGVALVYTF